MGVWDVVALLSGIVAIEVARMLAVREEPLLPWRRHRQPGAHERISRRSRGPLSR